MGPMILRIQSFGRKAGGHEKILEPVTDASAETWASKDRIGVSFTWSVNVVLQEVKSTELAVEVRVQC